MSYNQLKIKGQVINTNTNKNNSELEEYKNQLRYNMIRKNTKDITLNFGDLLKTFIMK